ncbi:MAG: hypothetical protein KAX10_06725 [Candidatus Lokiarchaeota archaeon]|nr:hypothetical protein [Candidatus Lokiarchaeota archaeon]
MSIHKFFKHFPGIFSMEKLSFTNSIMNKLGSSKIGLEEFEISNITF